jgi:hypothetical protein
VSPRDFPTFLSLVEELAPQNARVFLDEVPEVEGWQRLVRTLLDRGRQVCLTGSNASLLGRLDLVVVHRFDNDPPRRDPATVTEWADHGIGKTEFGRLLKLILDAKLH